MRDAGDKRLTFADSMSKGEAGDRREQKGSCDHDGRTKGHGRGASAGATRVAVNET